jgi:hypothetical protein
MRRRILGMFVIWATMIYLGSSSCSAADVRVMYAVGLLDRGENAKLLTTEECNRTVADYDEFRDRVAKATTLKAMVENGWTIVHVEQIRPGGGDSYRALNYLIILQGR